MSEYGMKYPGSGGATGPGTAKVHGSELRPRPMDALMADIHGRQMESARVWEGYEDDVPNVGWVYAVPVLPHEHWYGSSGVTMHLIPNVFHCPHSKADWNGNEEFVNRGVRLARARTSLTVRQIEYAFRRTTALPYKDGRHFCMVCMEALYWHTDYPGRRNR